MGAFILLALAFAAGWLANTMMFRYNVSENPEKMMEILNNLKEIKKINDKAKFEMKDPDVIARVENHGTLCYLFNTDSGQFLGQGKTIDDALEHASKRFPDAKILVE
jgi:hypothetical protein